MPDNWIVANSTAIRGKSGLQKTQCQLTTGKGDFRKVPQKINRLIKARVKR